MREPGSIMPRTAGPAEVLRTVLAEVDRGGAVAVATVVARRGSSPATPGQKLALAAGRPPVAPSGAEIVAVGTVGGGAVERSVIDLLFAALADPAHTPKLHTFRLGPSLGMCCGGAADVLIEVLRPGVAVLIVGAGHVGLATAKLLAELGFRVTLADSREGAAGPDRTESARAAGVQTVVADHDDPEVSAALGAAPAASAILSITHDHQLDQQVVEWGLRQGYRFVGGVGSRAKAERTRQRLAARGFDAEACARVRMPVGVEIGARRPLEIAVSIAGELVAWRARDEGIIRARGAESSAPEAEGEASLQASEESVGEPNGPSPARVTG